MGPMRPMSVENQRATEFRCGYIAVVGLPNVGKSTLVNRLVGQTVSIVAPRPQTTRHRILGILNGEGYQVLFLDTPGLLKPAYKLQELMEKEVEKALEDADLILLVVDVGKPQLEQIAEPLSSRVKCAGLLIAANKIDRTAKDELSLFIEQMRAVFATAEIHPVSALTGQGVGELKQTLVSALPVGEPLFPPDVVSERPERFFAAELVREAIFNRYGAEIPYSTTVVIDEFLERPGRKDYIKATIYVERGTQKAILIGRDGAALKKVGSIARRNIERFLGRPVYLELWVKVAESWRKNETFIRENVYRQ